MANWKIKKNNKTYGPFDGSRLKQLASEGKLLPDDLVSKEDSKWTPAKNVTGLFATKETAAVEPPLTPEPTPTLKLRKWELKTVLVLLLMGLIGVGGFSVWQKINEFLGARTQTASSSVDKDAQGSRVGRDLHRWQTTPIEPKNIFDDGLIIGRVRIGDARPEIPIETQGVLTVVKPAYILKGSSRERCAFSSNGQYLVFQEEFAKNPRIVDLIAGEELKNSIPVSDLRLFNRQESKRRSHAYSYDSSAVFKTCSLFRSKSVAEQVREKFGTTYGSDKPIGNFLSPNGKYAVHIDAFGKFHFGEFDDNGFKEKQLEVANFPGFRDQIVFSPDSRFLLKLSPKGIGIWNTETRKLLKEIESESPTFFLGFSPNSKTVALVYNDKASFLDTKSFEVISSFSTDEIDIEPDVSSLNFLSFLDENRLGFSSLSPRIANIKTNEIQKVQLPDRGRALKVIGSYCIGFQPKSLFVFDIKNERAILRIDTAREFKSDVQVDPTGRFVAVRFPETQTLEIFDLFDATKAGE
jgi:hypothetical protein